MSAMGLLQVGPCSVCAFPPAPWSSLSSPPPSYSAKMLAGIGQKTIPAGRFDFARSKSAFQDNAEVAANLKRNSSAGWPVKAVTNEPLNPGSSAGLYDEAEILKRQQLFNKIAPMYDNKVGKSGKVIGLDFAKEQLMIAADRQQDSSRTSAADIEWIQGDALSLPFEESSFDAITMGYGLRNVANIPRALAEIYRVLKPGRKASVLDFNRSPDPFTGEIQGFMLDNVVVPVATYFGVQEEYAYLKTSIARFPLGAEQERLAANEGFSKAVHYELAGGLMGVLVVTK